MDVVEASLDDLRRALDEGRVTSVGLVAEYLRRIASYDHHGVRLNSVPVLSRTAFADARAADVRRARGQLLSPLDGIPYTAKDSYKARGMTVSAGSPAFRDLVASEDSYVVGKLRAAGAVLLGLTTMPPMANGGMQRGLDGRAESPYNGAFLTSAWASGSSNGSGTATAASFAAFGLGEETWSSGRAPATNNALCAYTPSWGVISIRGNWPLVPTMDVVVPHTRSMADMLALLDVVVGDDDRTRGNFWRVQEWVDIPKASALRPPSYGDLGRDESARPLAGVRIGLPRCYLGNDERIPTRASVISLFKAATARLADLGAEVIECDFPARTVYEHENPAVAKDWFQGGLETRGYVPEGYFASEMADLCTFALDDFLAANAAVPGSRAPRSFSEVDPALVFPLPNGQIANDYGDDIEMADYVRFVKEGRARPPAEIPLMADGVRGLDRARREVHDAWMDKEGLSALAWPTVADVGPADADINRAAHAIATRDGTWVANGNLVIRHLGIPTVTLPMGLAEEIGMPFGLTLAGKGWDDNKLLRIAALLEKALPPRPVPPRTPSLGPVPRAPAHVATEAAGELKLDVRVEPRRDSRYEYTVRGTAPGPIKSATVTINGEVVTPQLHGAEFTATGRVAAEDLAVQHSQWRPPYGTMVVATVVCAQGELGAMAIVGGC